jgi:aryl-alcohol dehydrogenase-like predicted oxidoreductase
VHAALDAGIIFFDVAPSFGAVAHGLRGSLARNAAILDRIPAGRWADPEEFGR